MSFQEYSLLLVSVSETLNNLILSLFSADGAVTSADCINAARRILSERTFDLVIINAPLPDGFGTRLAVDTCMNSEAGVMLLANCELFEEICAQAMPSGVIVAEKPLDRRTLIRSLYILCAVRERLRGMEEKRISVEEKIREIRLVNRAKWLLIERLGMSEPDAHRYIEKEAMNQRTSRRNIAERVIQTYK